MNNVDLGNAMYNVSKTIDALSGDAEILENATGEKTLGEKVITSVGTSLERSVELLETALAEMDLEED